MKTHTFYINKNVTLGIKDYNYNVVLVFFMVNGQIHDRCINAIKYIP
jgi:hypothetical protein